MQSLNIRSPAGSATVEKETEGGGEEGKGRDVWGLEWGGGGKRGEENEEDLWL